MTQGLPAALPRSTRWLPLAAIGASHHDPGAVQLQRRALSGVATAAIPALGYGFALLLGEPIDPIKALGGAIAPTGVIIATLASPAVEPSPPGSALPEPAELAMHDPSPTAQTGSGTSAEEGTQG